MGNKQLLLACKSVSYLGTKLFSFSMSWYILATTGSGLSFSISLIANYLPTIFISFFAGYISDSNKNPKKILIICDLLSAGICFLPIIKLSEPTLYICIFLLSAVSSVYNNVIDSRIPNLQGIDSSERVKKMMSAMQFVVALVNIIAPALGGLIIKYVTIIFFALINIVSFVLSAIGETQLRYNTQSSEASVSKTLDSTCKHSVIRYLFTHRYFRTILIADGIGNFCVSAGISIALPFIITQTFHLSSVGYGSVSSALAFGSIFSSFINIKYPGDTSLSYPFIKTSFLGINLLILAVITFLAPQDTSLVIILLCILQFINGWLMVSINIKVLTTVQINIPNDIRGKVLGIMTSISYILIPTSLALAGICTKILPTFVLPLTSGLILLLSMFLLKLPFLKNNSTKLLSSSRM